MLLNSFPYSSSTVTILLYYCVDFFHIILGWYYFFSSGKIELNISEKKITVDYCFLRGHHSIRACQLREHSDCCDISM